MKVITEDTLHVSHPSHTYSSLVHCSPEVSQLYVAGRHPELLSEQFAGRRVGVVGTRDATLAGLADAKRIAYVLARAGAVIVSGMALGIDGAAHQGALESEVEACTIAVLGSGVDVVYPRRHEKLAQQIREHGCIVSEHDCGTPALAWHFPIRNRIIAALSDVLVVPEGTLKGGARITVDLALAMGKTICAVPGPRRSRASELCNAIIKDGAVCITDPADVLRELGIESNDVGWEPETILTHNREPLTGHAQKVVTNLSHGPLSVHDVGHMCRVTERESLRLLSHLESHGFVRFRRGMYELSS